MALAGAVRLGLTSRTATEGLAETRFLQKRPTLDAYHRASWLSITPIPLPSSRPPGSVPVKVPKGWR